MPILMLMAAAAAFVWFVHHRGLLFVQAYMYLMVIVEQPDCERANFSVKKMLDPGLYMRDAKGYAEANFGGRQLPVIRQARSLGFRG